MYKILAKLSAIVAAVLLLLGIIDKIFFPHSNILLQHENYFLAANPFILFGIFFLVADYVYSGKNKE
ncbi:MAG TPA: hypothetical protein ENG70_01950 [Candidatus Cloacimonetes bacterium]|nr:hypothetical protein [Candidatus Cloacimonadota bacterium]HEX37613.1 hypothetical protein [Candidatus Cloacimonadota bacterium]